MPTPAHGPEALAPAFPKTQAVFIVFSVFYDVLASSVCFLGTDCPPTTASPFLAKSPHKTTHHPTYLSHTSR